MDGSGPSIVVSGPHEEFFNSALALWIGVKHFPGGCCRPIRMHELSKALGLSQLRGEQLSILWQDVSMRRARLVPGKHGMSALMIALKEA